MKMMNARLGHAVLVLSIVTCAVAAPLQRPDEGISIVNNRVGVQGTQATKYDAGPSFGDILNNHLFPGLEDYRIGSYAYAKIQMDYFLDRPKYTAMNPRQAQFITLAYYVRGMIYLEHATGLGRHALAIADFKKALEWDAENHMASLALAQAYAALGNKSEASGVLKEVLAKPGIPAEIQQEAKKQLENLSGSPPGK
jgi:tetratricopeptide (TPR) repeat protein